MEEKKNIGGLFDRIAWTYDRLNHLLSLNIDRRWRKQAVRDMQQAEQVLDVAVGTGDLSMEMFRQGKANRIIGIDLSNEMMRIANDKARENGYAERFQLEQINAQEMPYSNAMFDAVTCAYGLRNFADADKGLSEMYRVLKPNGELIILEFSYPTNPVIRALYDFYFGKIMPQIGRVFSQDAAAYKYLYSSVKHFMWGEEMAEHIRQAGFQEVSYLPQTFGISTLYLAKK